MRDTPLQKFKRWFDRCWNGYELPDSTDYYYRHQYGETMPRRRVPPCWLARLLKKIGCKIPWQSAFYFAVGMATLIGACATVVQCRSATVSPDHSPDSQADHEPAEGAGTEDAPNEVDHIEPLEATPERAAIGWVREV